jgi:hypothetical protein
MKHLESYSSSQAQFNATASRKPSGHNPHLLRPLHFIITTTMATPPHGSQALPREGTISPVAWYTVGILEI